MKILGNIGITKLINLIASKFQQRNTAVTHTVSTAVGSDMNPVYVNTDGVATPCTYDLNKTVPADAVFTDTVYTHPTDAVNTGSFGLAANVSLTFGETFDVPYVTVDEKGHVTAASTKTVTTPSAAATTSIAGLMSAADKTKLDDIATGANAYTHPTDGTNTGSFGPSADANPSHGGTFSVPYVTVNEAGHVTAASTKTITLPAGYTHPSDGANTGSFGPSTDATATHGGTISVPYITVNSDGHVTAASTKTITLPSDSDTQVTNTLGTTTKFYLTGTTSDTTNTGTQYFDTGIYSTTTAGQLYVTSLALPSGIIIS